MEVPSRTELRVSVSDFVALLNQTLEYAYPSLTITGELANLRVSKNKWVYFDLKDELASVKCFGTVYQLPGPLEDGLLLNVRGMPRVHPLYGFSFNVQSIQPAGEGSIRRAAELLAAKLTAEGLFDPARKRALPYPPERIGLITSRESAAYADFIKILAARWGGLDIQLAHVQVQGASAPEQIVRAIEQFNTLAEPPEVLVLTRGGGSADDLSAFSSEQVTRAVAASRIPTLVAIGHEIDISLSELAADQRASTPSNAAELLVPDKRSVLIDLRQASGRLQDLLRDYFSEARRTHLEALTALHRQVRLLLEQQGRQLSGKRQLLEVLSPEAVLRRGYAIVRQSGRTVRSARSLRAGDIVDIQLIDAAVEAAVTKKLKPPRRGD